MTEEEIQSAAKYSSEIHSVETLVRIIGQLREQSDFSTTNNTFRIKALALILALEKEEQAK